MSKQSTDDLALKANTQKRPPKDKKTTKQTKERMVFRDGKLTARIPSASLKQVMEEFSRRTGVKVLWQDRQMDRNISVGFSERSTEEALQNILHGENYLLFYTSAKEGEKLTRILILPNNKENEKSAPIRRPFLPPPAMMQDFGTFGSQSRHNYIMRDFGGGEDNYNVRGSDYSFFLESDNKGQDINDFPHPESDQTVKEAKEINETAAIDKDGNYINNKQAFPMPPTMKKGYDSMPDNRDSCTDESPMGLDADEDGCLDNLEGLLLLIRNELNITAGLQNDLALKIEYAQNSVSEDDAKAAIDHLKAFINIVEENVDEQISPEDIDMLSTYAANIIVSLLSDDLILEHAGITFNISGLLEAGETVSDIIELLSGIPDVYGSFEILDDIEHIAQTGSLETIINDLDVYSMYKSLQDLDRSLDTIFCIDFIRELEL
jgi:hypothetical protein